MKAKPADLLAPGEDTTLVTPEMQDARRRCKVDGNIFSVDGMLWRMELTRCGTHREVVAAVLHLLEKDWATREIVELFLKEAIAANNLEVGGF